MLLAIYPTKKTLKAEIGKPLKYRETSLFGKQYRRDGSLWVANRPQLTGLGREWFAKITMSNGLIQKVE